MKERLRGSAKAAWWREPYGANLNAAVRTAETGLKGYSFTGRTVTVLLAFYQIGESPPEHPAGWPCLEPRSRHRTAVHPHPNTVIGCIWVTPTRLFGSLSWTMLPGFGLAQAEAVAGRGDYAAIVKPQLRTLDLPLIVFDCTFVLPKTSAFWVSNCCLAIWGPSRGSTMLVIDAKATCITRAEGSPPRQPSLRFESSLRTGDSQRAYRTSAELQKQIEHVRADQSQQYDPEHSRQMIPPTPSVLAVFQTGTVYKPQPTILIKVSPFLTKILRPQEGTESAQTRSWSVL